MTEQRPTDIVSNLRSASYGQVPFPGPPEGTDAFVLDLDLVSRRSIVYVLRDEKDVVLYVGVTDSFAQRYVAHLAEKGPTFRPVRAYLFDFGRDRTAALRYERKLIEAYHPPYNVTHTDNPRGVKPRVHREVFCLACGERTKFSQILMCKFCARQFASRVDQARRLEAKRAGKRWQDIKAADWITGPILDQMCRENGRAPASSALDKPKDHVVSRGKYLGGKRVGDA